MKDFNKFEPYIESACRTILDMIQSQGLSLKNLKILYHHFLTLLPPFAEEELHCRAGCGYCCHLKVSVSIAEALIILDYLQEHDKLHQHKEQIEILDEPFAQRASADNSWWVKNAIPCLFLDKSTSLCSIYEVRPFSCRAYHSLDELCCKKGYLDRNEIGIPCYLDLKRSRELYSVAFERALAQLGLQSAQFELSSTIGLFLQSPDRIEQWAQGESVLPPI
jgi:Fe-S-cluster containining protein